MESPSNYNKYKYIITPDCYKCNKLFNFVDFIVLYMV